MTKHLLDAVKTAKSIHNGNYSSLRGKSFVTCDKMKKTNGRNKHVKKSNEERMTLTKLAKIVSDGFSEVRQDIRDLKQDVKGINARLDYIVSVNNLKDLPKTKSK